MTKMDGVFSQYFLPLHQEGYYSSICKFHTNVTGGLRIFALPSFHVEQPMNFFQNSHDQMAPNAITDLHVQVQEPTFQGAHSLTSFFHFIN